MPVHLVGDYDPPPPERLRPAQPRQPLAPEHPWVGSTWDPPLRGGPLALVEHEAAVERQAERRRRLDQAAARRHERLGLDDTDDAGR